MSTLFIQRSLTTPAAQQNYNPIRKSADPTARTGFTSAMPRFVPFHALLKHRKGGATSAFNSARFAYNIAASNYRSAKHTRRACRTPQQPRLLLQ